MSFKKNIAQRFEELISKLAIPDYLERIYRHAVINLFSSIKAKLTGGIYFFPGLFQEDFSDPIILENPFYGGSFDRHTNIKGVSDIDVYFLYKLRKYRSYLGLAAFSRDLLKYQMNIDDIKGDMLLKKLFSQFRKLEQNSVLYSNYNLPIIKIKKNPPYRHAIPIFVRYKGYSFNIDCIPAIKVNNGNDLIIPDFNGSVKVNPTKDENALANLNRKHDGKATKLIRLIKYWNEINGHKLKSYLIERLVEKIFEKKPMNTWASTVKTFFQDAIHILRNRIKLVNKVYTHHSILDEFSDEKLEEMIISLQDAVRWAQEDYFYDLFKL